MKANPRSGILYLVSMYICISVPKQFHRRDAKYIMYFPFCCDFVCGSVNWEKLKCNSAYSIVPFVPEK